MARLGDYIREESNPLGSSGAQDLQLIGVSNEHGLHASSRDTSDDLSRYQRIERNWFAYNPMRVNIGSIGLADDKSKTGFTSPDYTVFSCREGLDPHYLLHFLKSDYGLEAIARNCSGAVRKRLYYSGLSEIELPIPDIQQQRAVVAKIHSIGETIRFIRVQNSDRHELPKLKQAILQEAIQGKLTADWRAVNLDVESASKLLQRIQAEKARIVAKKLRPEKPLPKITAEEIPFETPSGWEWTRLGDVCEKTGSGSTPSGGKTAYSTTGIPFLRSQNVHNSGLVLDGVAYISTAIHASMKGTTVYPQDILLNITGGSIGRCALVSNEIEEANVNQHVAIIRPLLRSSGSFLHSVILSPYFQNKVDEAQTGAGREGLPKNKMDRILIPLPSLAEQAAIMEKVEALMMICRALETEIERARTHAADLLQAVLREAFSGKLVAQDANDKPAPATAKVIPFPAKNLTRIANISPTDLQAGIIAMAYQRHEQIPKYLQHFHHVKAEKIVHLVEAHLGIDLERMPVKAAAGPNDYPHLKKVESRAKKANWFDVRQAKTGGVHTYYKKSGFDALLDKAAAAFGERAAEVDALINLLLPLNTRQAEIVATLYAAWNNLLLLGRSPSDEEIVYEARENWHSSKLEIEREKFFRGLEWMRKHGLIAAGRGRYVDAK